MLHRQWCQLVVGAFFLGFAHAAVSENVWLTDKQFENRGAGAFVGTIQSVQIESSAPAFESGTVELQVNKVIAGSLAAQTISFPYQRALVSSDDSGNWDLIAPLGASLQTIIGEELLIYFAASGDTYSIYPASNSVQAVENGVLVGTIDSVKLNHDFTVSVEIQVSETVFGWVSGTTVTLPISSDPVTGWGGGRSGASFALAAPVPGSLGAGQSFSTSIPAGKLDESFCQANHGTPFAVEFANGKITGVAFASKRFLTTLHTLDSE